MTCPHANVVDCPLYHSSHVGNGHGCDDGRLQEGACAAARRLDYAGALAALRIADPRLVALVEWEAAKRAGQRQRRRNMQLLGVH